MKRQFLTKPPAGIQLNRAHPLAQRLSALYLFNEGAGERVTDLVTQRTALFTKNGSTSMATWTGGKTGKAILFTGNGATGNSIDCGRHPSVNNFPNAYISIVLWVNPRVSNSEDAYLAKWTNASGERSYFFGSHWVSFKRPYFSISKDGGQTNWFGVATTNTTVLVDGIWQQLAATYDGVNIALYYNGVKMETETIFGSAQNAIYEGVNNKLTIGGAEDGTAYFFDGAQDNARVYNRCLSPSEVMQLYSDPYQDLLFQKIPRL